METDYKVVFSVGESNFLLSLLLCVFTFSLSLVAVYFGYTSLSVLNYF